MYDEGCGSSDPCSDILTGTLHLARHVEDAVNLQVFHERGDRREFLRRSVVVLVWSCSRLLGDAVHLDGHHCLVSQLLMHLILLRVARKSKCPASLLPILVR